MDEFVIIAISVIVIAAAIAIIVFAKRSKKSEIAPAQETQVIETSLPMIDPEAKDGPTDLTFRFEDLPALTETEEASLVEIKDSKLLARIDGVVPGTMQVVANVGAVNQYQQIMKSTGQLYQVILPQGATLSDSKAMEGAVRAFYHGTNGIKGHGNLVAVDGDMGGGLATMSVANAAMGAAAMVVGQYYMTQINNQLGDINSELDKISSFQDKEYQSKIAALIIEVQQYSQFQVETVENEELRTRALDQLASCEHECTQLLDQAIRTLKEFGEQKGLDYSDYEKRVAEAQTWYQYQQILLEILRRIEDLKYALNLGKVSKENCYFKSSIYSGKVDEALAALESWHKDTGIALEIDLEAERRRRKGVEGFFMSLPALFNDNLHYKDISKRTASMINKQSAGRHDERSQSEQDLFQEDVRLIAKDGKLYYLPKQKELEESTETGQNEMKTSEE